MSSPSGPMSNVSDGRTVSAIPELLARYPSTTAYVVVWTYVLSFLAARA